MGRRAGGAGRRAARRALAAALLAGLVAGGAGAEGVPGPPLERGGDLLRAWCPAPGPGQGPWHAATFGAAVLGIAWVSRRRGEAR